MSRQRVKFLYVVLSAVISISLSAGFMVWYVTEQNQKMCDVLAISTADRPKPPTYPVYTEGPATDFGLQLETYNKALDVYQKKVELFNQIALAKTRKLAKDYHCEGVR